MNRFSKNSAMACTSSSPNWGTPKSSGKSAATAKTLCGTADDLTTVRRADDFQGWLFSLSITFHQDQVHIQYAPAISSRLSSRSIFRYDAILSGDAMTT